MGFIAGVVLCHASLSVAVTVSVKINERMKDIPATKIRFRLGITE